MGSGGAGLPRGGGRRAEGPLGLAGPCRPGTGPPVIPESGLSGLAPWVEVGGIRGFLSSTISFWEKRSRAGWYKLSCGQDGGLMEGAPDPSQSDGGDCVLLRE